ncbi:MAG: FtsW/RodA/SpoVE family cell cycle protein [Coriobacteriia bacterium]|nr:FtsW/RodA/SpoVE family cell cycle protein [Coriobacteriia bacterium]
MTRRNIELILLCIAAPLVILLFAMVALNSGEKLGWENLGVPAGMFACFVVAHLAIRKLAPGADPAILPIAFALSGIGIAFITRLDPSLASRQIIWLFVGIIFMVLTLILLKNLDKVANYKYTLMIAGCLLLLSPLLPGIGSEQYGSRIWLSIGGFSFQPGEIAKILIVLFLASYLAQNRELLSTSTRKLGPLRLPDLPTLLPLLIMWAISMLIVVFEKDLGSAIVVFLVFLSMLYVASGRKLYLVVGLAFVSLGFVLCYFTFSHVQTRVDIWLNPFADPTNKGFQLVQSLYSLADGGLFGVGIGNGLAQNIPIVESDFIFACIGEETGLLGASGLLLLYLCFAVRGMVSASRAKSDVSSFVAVGVTAIIIVQAFIIVGGVTGFIPLTGLTLPFVSQGGSSLLASFIIVGLLLRCGDEGVGNKAELVSATTQFASIGGKHGQALDPDASGVLGRVSLGRRITSVMVVFALMIAALIANLTMVMVVNANEYQNMSGNNHTLAKESKTERGTISTKDGTVLAKSVQQSDGTYKRVYPAGTLASHVVGYASQTYGTAGIEAACNDALKGNRNFSSWMDVINNATGNTTAGNDVKLTINSKIQKAAEKALSGYKGACVVMDPETGAVLAMASSPTYSNKDVEKLLSSGSGDSSLYNRATQALYPPGSTFKIVSLTTALGDDIAKETTMYKAPSKISIGNADITNMHGASYGEITLARATELSSNTVYGQLGSEIGPQKLVEGAQAFGFGDAVDFELPLATSLMPEPSEMTDWETAWAACGVPVGEHASPAGPQTTVLQMAMVGAAIANDGVICQPHLVDSIYGPTGECSYTTSSKTYAKACSTSTAQRVKKVLEGVVENGTGRSAQISGTSIAGKTGTAETDKATDDSWFVGMGPTDDCKMVIAIALEESGSGVACRRSHDVMKTALEEQGAL